MLGPGTYEDSSCGFNSQFSFTVRGCTWVNYSKFDRVISVRTVGSHGEIWNKIDIPTRSAYKLKDEKHHEQYSASRGLAFTIPAR